MRLNRFIAASGVCSRREADRLIQSGAISVNGSPVSVLGTEIDPQTDTVSFRGKTLSIESPVLYRFYKPEHVLSTLGSDEHRGRKTISDFLTGIKERVYNVGRLDFDVSGIMLLTNDGELANRLMHPRYGNEREYVALVENTPSAATLKQLVEGIELEDGHASAKSASVLSSQHFALGAPAQGAVPPRSQEARFTPDLYCKDLFRDDTNTEGAFIRLTVVEGRNHFVKRLLAEVGHPVERLIRIRFGDYDLNGLQPGQLDQVTKSSKLT